MYTIDRQGEAPRSDSPPVLITGEEVSETMNFGFEVYAQGPPLSFDPDFLARFQAIRRMRPLNTPMSEIERLRIEMTRLFERRPAGFDNPEDSDPEDADMMEDWLEMVERLQSHMYQILNRRANQRDV